MTVEFVLADPNPRARASRIDPGSDADDSRVGPKAPFPTALTERDRMRRAFNINRRPGHG